VVVGVVGRKEGRKEGVMVDREREGGWGNGERIGLVVNGLGWQCGEGRSDNLYLVEEFILLGCDGVLSMGLRKWKRKLWVVAVGTRGLFRWVCFLL